jgi:hypothetical protein
MEVDNKEGSQIRLEMWAYHGGKTSFTFTDGVFKFEGEVEALPVGYVPTPYHPNQFPLGSTPEQIMTLLPGVTIVPVQNSEGIQQGVLLYSGQQLILGFLNERLYYVDAMVFVPEGSE